MKRALISVSDKTGLTRFAHRLEALGVEILSTGGTARALRADGVSVTDVSSYTGFPEMLDGRVKTLHPLIHAGILARRGVDDAALAQHGVKPIDLVVVNLYPFERTVADPACSLAHAIENIDIGGPSMLRAAAKNYLHVAVVVDPADYPAIIEELNASGGQLSAGRRYALAVKAFTHSARYDGVISNYLSARDSSGGAQRYPAHLNLQFHKAQDLRYGENPHQSAAFYVEREPAPGSVSTARQLQGRELSFNNIADADAAVDCVTGFAQPACVIVKHANPCGVAEGDDALAAYRNAYRTDPTSAFGGVIAFNRPLTAAVARAVIERQVVDVIIAPIVEADALEALAARGNVRVLETGVPVERARAVADYKHVTGGLLVQDRDGQAADELANVKVVTQRAPTSDELRDLAFAWRVAQAVKSNAIVYAKNAMTIGIGAGQTSRVMSARIAAMKAKDEGLELEGSVMASDAFFPFRDGIDTAAAHGISAVIQPGGSLRDEEVIAAADQHRVAMVFTGVRHFRH
jgi:phosphoribosylaminoimidazolecarboxamide formyltransferase/IMP cyclohydrolase